MQALVLLLLGVGQLPVFRTPCVVLSVVSSVAPTLRAQHNN